MLSKTIGREDLCTRAVRVSLHDLYSESRVRFRKKLDNSVLLFFSVNSEYILYHIISKYFLFFAIDDVYLFFRHGNILNIHIKY